MYIEHATFETLSRGPRKAIRFRFLDGSGSGRGSSNQFSTFQTWRDRTILDIKLNYSKAVNSQLDFETGPDQDLDLASIFPLSSIER